MEEIFFGEQLKDHNQPDSPQVRVYVNDAWPADMCTPFERPLS